MSFLSNVLDAIPVVGHAKAVVHYAVGDVDGGNNALYQSTRTSAVLAGGAIGSVAGPGGAAVGAMYGGFLSDGLATAATGKPQGIVKDCQNVGKDIQRGENPTASLLTTGVHLGLDAVGGLGMGGVSSAPASSIGKKIASDVGEEIIEQSVKLTVEEAAKMTTRKVSETVVKKTVEKAVIQTEISLVSTHIAGRVCKMVKDVEQREGKAKVRNNEMREGNNENKAEKGKQSEKETGKNTSQSKIGSGGQPPERDKDNNKKSDGCNEPDPFSDFLELLEELLKNFTGDIIQLYRICQNLEPGQIQYLKKQIKILMNHGMLEAVLKLVIEMFAKHFLSELTFANFLGLMEFVRTYINNEVEEYVMISQRTDQLTTLELRDSVLSSVLSKLDLVRKIVDTFNNIWVQIQSENANYPIYPNFRGRFSSVYHYFKHRIVPGDRILTVSQYYGWIRFVLQKVKKLQEYSDLTGPNTRRQINYEICIAFGKEIRRIRIIIKIQFGKIVLSSLHFIYMVFDGDKNGDIFINPKRKNVNSKKK